MTETNQTRERPRADKFIRQLSWIWKILSAAFPGSQAKLTEETAVNLTEGEAASAEQVETRTAPQTGKKEKLEVNVEVNGGNVLIAEKLIPREKLREIQFARKDAEHFEVIVQTFGKRGGDFSGYSEKFNEVVGVIEEDKVPALIDKIDKLEIRTLLRSPLRSIV